MLRSKYLQISLALITVLIVCTGCATADRHILPKLSEPPRVGLDLKPPILGAVFDGRANQAPKDAVLQLQTDLKRIYGSSIEWVDYFSKTPSGRVTVRVRIGTLGASFGSRLISNVALANAVSSAQGAATGPWGNVVSSSSSHQSVFSSSFSGEGWWNGSAWVDIEVQDYRGTVPISFVMPIVAEHRESNTWGYASGDKAVNTAWQQGAIQITRFLDNALRSVR